MKKLFIVLLISTSALAGTPSKVLKAAKEMKTGDVRTVVTQVENTDGNPCMPAGKSYNIDMQVKMAAFDQQTHDVVYHWETVKTINSTADGLISEVCGE